MSFKKTPTIEGATIAGTELSLLANLDLPIIQPQPGVSDFPFAVYFGQGKSINSTDAAAVNAEEGPAATITASQEVTAADYFNLFEAVLSFMQPIIPLNPPSTITTGTNKVYTPRDVKLIDRNVDVLEEFRQDIKSIVLTVAQEFTKLKNNSLEQQQGTMIKDNENDHSVGSGGRGGGAYPSSTPAGLTVNSNAIGVTTGTEIPPRTPMDALKIEFMTFLSESGVLHDFKDKLRPRILQIIYDRCGPKGLAWGNSKYNPSNVYTSPEEEEDNNINNNQSPFMTPSLAEIGKMLNDIYVILMNESNLVLNSIYESTLIDRHAAELDTKPLINDEVETNEQAFNRLGFQAMNAEADNRFLAAEQYHLERICLAKILTSSVPSGLHEAYLAYADSYLHYSMSLVTVSKNKNNKNINPSELNGLWLKGHQILNLAKEVNPDDVKTLLLLACSHMRLDRPYEAEQALVAVLNAAIRQNCGLGSTMLTALEDVLQFTAEGGGVFDVILKYVDPVCYSVMAALLSKKSATATVDPLLIRKAILMATYAYDQYKSIEASSLLFKSNEYNQDGVSSTPGIPRRTAVLCLAKTSIYLYEYGFSDLGAEALKLAWSCERASNQKAQYKQVPSVTPPTVRVILKRAEFYNQWISSSFIGNHVTLNQQNDLLDAAIDW